MASARCPRRRALHSLAALALVPLAGCAAPRAGDGAVTGLNRPLAAASPGAAPASGSQPAPEPATLPMVLSIDDGPMLATLTLLSPAQRHDAMRAALAHERVEAVMFMTAGFGADRPEGLALAQAWAAAGHRLANHTVSHLDLHDPAVTLDRYLAEIDACEALGRTLPHWRRWFRATYLNAGRDAAQRQALREALAARGYTLAEVDLDSRDWQFAGPLQAQLLSTPDARAPAVQALRTRFLQQLDERTAALAAAARAELRERAAHAPAAVPGGGSTGARAAAADPASRTAHPRPQVLLVHDQLPMALWLPEVLALMRRHGFVFVAPEHAWPPAPRPLRAGLAYTAQN